MSARNQPKLSPFSNLMDSLGKIGRASHEAESHAGHSMGFHFWDMARRRGKGDGWVLNATKKALALAGWHLGDSLEEEAGDGSKLLDHLAAQEEEELQAWCTAEAPGWVEEWVEECTAGMAEKWGCSRRRAQQRFSEVTTEIEAAIFRAQPGLFGYDQVGM